MNKKRQKANRRRLFTRDKANLPPLSLTKRDISILKLVADYHFLNTDQIQALIGGSPRNVSERLSRLFHHGYLDRPTHQRELRCEGYRVLIHALGPKGARFLAQRAGDSGPPSHHLGENNRRAKKIYLAHRLMISQFRACLTLACRKDPRASLSKWETPERTITRIQLDNRRVPVIPDAYLAIRNQSGRSAHFFLEADRGTMTQKRFLLKLRAYWGVRGMDSDTLFPRAFRVLTIAPSRRRMENLIQTATKADPNHRGSRMFYFTYEDLYSLDRPSAILGHIWRTPADGKLHSLLEGKRR